MEPEKNPTDETKRTGGGTRRLKGMIASLVYLVVMAALLFIPAGSTGWPMAWALLAIYLVGAIVHNGMASMDLLEERSRDHGNAMPYDKYLVAAIATAGLVSMVVAGLDFRYGWTGTLPAPVQAAAAVMVAASSALVIWATVTNPFFSAAIRIQDDRNQRVVSSGPYRYIRHPGYAGWILYILFLPPMLGSLVALIPGAIAAGLDVVRTYLEDQILTAELEGYREYAGRVRYRLVPGAW